MELSIGDVAQRAAIATSAIRFYESEGLIEPAQRRNGRRIYGPEILDRLTIIELAKNAGFTIAEIRRLLCGFAEGARPGERWRTLAKQKLEELDQRIKEAQHMKHLLEQVSRCACPTFDDCAQALRKRA